MTESITEEAKHICMFTANDRGSYFDVTTMASYDDKKEAEDMILSLNKDLVKSKRYDKLAMENKKLNDFKNRMLEICNDVRMTGIPAMLSRHTEIMQIELNAKMEMVREIESELELVKGDAS